MNEISKNQSIQLVTRRMLFLRVSIALLLVVALLIPAGSAFAAKKGKRYGLEGRVQKYDEARGVLTVRVVKTKVSGGAGAGRVAGKPAPKGIKRGSVLDFAVVPDGSVLRRTVIKNRDGGGLDTTGTKEGFRKALAMVPRDKNVVFSFERIKKPKEGDPKWDLRIIQLRMSEAEAEARYQAMLKEQAKKDAQEKAARN